MWYKSERVKTKSKKVVVKLYYNNDYIDTCVVPSKMFPLNGNYEVFNSLNTKKIKDQKVLDIFDSIEYKIGHCYTNTENLTKALKDQGYNAKQYCGWLFVSNFDYPIHHSWTVLNNSVLDLADDYTVMLSGPNGEHFKDADTKEKTALLIVDFLKAAMKEKNSLRCQIVGKPTTFLFYVGCECGAEEGRQIYQNLLKEYPNHVSEQRCDNEGYTPAQRLFQKEGLMK